VGVAGRPEFKERKRAVFLALVDAALSQFDGPKAAPRIA
jgi:hypothetical protein